MSRDVWKTYGFWAFWVGIAFFSVYPTCNWISAQQSNTYNLYLASELNIPFLPEFFWVYVSMYVLFLMPPFFLTETQLKALGKQLIAGTVFSALIFLAMPSNLGFTRTVPESPFYQSLYSTLFSIDLPHNMVPSLHVVFSALILLSLIKATSKKSVRLLWWGWLILICFSTLLVHQHHILDVLTGLLIAFLFSTYIQGRKTT